MNIGKFKLTAIDTSIFALDGGAMFGVVPKALWSKMYNSGDDQNRIPLSARPLLVEWEDRKMLIDTGNGDKFNQKFADMYSLNSTESAIENALAKINITPDQITDVVLTHLHFDHAGGATKFENNQIVPTFANAKYYVQKEHLSWAENPTEKDRASFINDNWLPLAEQLELLDGEGSLFDGVNLYLSDGHTKSMQLVEIEDGGSSLLFCADLCPTSAHIGLPFSMGYDNFPLSVMNEKKRLFPQAYEKGTILYFEHDAFNPTAKLTTHKDWFRADIVKVF